MYFFSFFFFWVQRENAKKKRTDKQNKTILSRKEKDDFVGVFLENCFVDLNYTWVYSLETLLQTNLVKLYSIVIKLYLKNKE